MAWRLEYDDIVRGLIAESMGVRRTIYLDPGSGSDGADGRKVDSAVKTLAAARGLITSAKHDRIVLVDSPTSGGSFLSLAANPLWTEKLTRFSGNAQGGWLGRVERRRPQRHVGAIAQGHGHLPGRAVDLDVSEELQAAQGGRFWACPRPRRFRRTALPDQRVVERARPNVPACSGPETNSQNGSKSWNWARLGS